MHSQHLLKLHKCSNFLAVGASDVSLSPTLTFYFGCWGTVSWNLLLADMRLFFTRQWHAPCRQLPPFNILPYCLSALALAFWRPLAGMITARRAAVSLGIIPFLGGFVSSLNQSGLNCASISGNLTQTSCRFPETSGRWFTSVQKIFRQRGPLVRFWTCMMRTSTG